MKNEDEILSKHTGYSIAELHERLTEPILQPYDCAMAMAEFSDQANDADPTNVIALPTPSVSKMSLSDKEIEDHIWEYFPEGLNAKDKENNTEAYKRYLQVVELVKDMRNIP